MNKFKLGVVGSGFMAKAIINGVISSGFIKPSDIIVSDVSDDALKPLAEKGVNTVKDNQKLFGVCEFVLFAIKPQTFYSISSQLKGFSGGKIISIMAGVKKENIKNNIPNVQVVRCMPNTPCSLGCGAVGIDVSDFTAQSDIEFVKNMFSSFAEVVFVDEEKLNAVTAISGSSPAYFYLFAQNLINAGVENGLSFEDAKKLVVSTMVGSGKMILTNDKPLDELIDAVCSKGGTTIEAVKIFKNSDFSKIISDAVLACKNKAFELEENK